MKKFKTFEEFVNENYSVNENELFKGEFSIAGIPFKNAVVTRHGSDHGVYVFLKKPDYRKAKIAAEELAKIEAKFFNTKFIGYNIDAVGDQVSNVRSHSKEDAIKFANYLLTLNESKDENTLNEWTDQKFSGAKLKKEVKKPSSAGMKLFKKYFPIGVKSEKNALKSLDKHDASGIKQRMGPQFAPMFVHVQYHEFNDAGTNYRVHQTQYYNSNFKDDPDFNPSVTAIALTNIDTDEKYGTVIVKTEEYIKDLEVLRRKGMLGERVS